MITHCAEHPVLQISKGHVVGKAVSVDLSVMVTVRIAANDKHTVSAVTSHVAQTRGLVVEYEVRDCPGHRVTKRVRGGSANDAMGGSGNRAALLPFADVCKSARRLGRSCVLGSVAGSGAWLKSGFRAPDSFGFFTKGWKHSTIAHPKCPSLSCRLMMSAGWPL